MTSSSLVAVDDALWECVRSPHSGDATLATDADEADLGRGFSASFIGSMLPGPLTFMEPVGIRVPLLVLPTDARGRCE
jgi:hypothetical protein